jgi:hypothetical protein
MPKRGQKMKNLISDERILIVQTLSLVSKDGHLPRGLLQQQATKLSVHVPTHVDNYCMRANPLNNSPGIH